MLKKLAVYGVAALTLLCGGLQAADKGAATGKNASPTASKFVVGTNDLGAKLLVELAKRKKDPNLVISPTSISLAVSMLANGADGKTLDEIAAVLGTDAKSLASWNQSASDFMDDSIQSDVDLEIANALFAQKGCSIQPAFAKTVQKSYRGRTRELDFLKDNKGSVDAINEWVKRNTGAKIDKLVDSVDKDTQAVLANAIYFKAEWMDKFSKGLTQDRSFATSTNESKKVATMVTEATMNYLDAPTFQAVSLDYKGERFCMWVMLPKKLTTTSALVSGLGHASVQQYAKQFKPEYGKLYLPKVKTKFDEEINADLKKVGMKLVFDKQNAELGKIFDPKTAKFSQFAVDKVVHKTFLNVDEDGTEAAAVTGIVLVGVASIPPQPKFVQDVDRPFVFLIRDKDTGANLFIGIVGDPSK